MVRRRTEYVKAGTCFYSKFRVEIYMAGFLGYLTKKLYNDKIDKKQTLN